jgi:chemotaxis protein methyltransferase CheR
MRVPLTDVELRLWGEWLSATFGLHFGPEKREMLRSRLEPRRAALGLDSFEQLLFHLKFHPEREAERERVIPHLTNHETYFCREPGALEVVRAEALPWIRERVGPAGEARLLSAACSTGEEAYTLAILAREPGGLAPAGPVRVTGVDIDPRSLEAARAGRYGEHAFRGTGPGFRRRYFREAEEGRAWEVLPALREGTEFRQANLADPDWAAGLPPQHLVLCRNAMIYFDEEGVRRAAEGLYRALAPGGWLFLGAAETLRRVPTPFRVERRPGAVFYRRPEEGAA